MRGTSDGERADGAGRWLRRLRLARRVGKAAALAGVAVGARRALSRKDRRRPVDRPVPLPHERTAGRRIALLFLLSAAAGIGLLVLYALGGQVQLEGVLLGLALGGIGCGLILWGKHLFPHEIVTEEREPHGSEPATLEITQELIEESEEAITRRSLLTRLLLGALGALAVAFVFPIRSLGPSPGRTLFVTKWRKDMMLVDENGVPIRADTLDINGVITAFPQGYTNSTDSVAIVVKCPPDILRLPPGRRDWAPSGNVCYSKLCTHAGCPVGLYLAETHELQCPCHQSAFDVTNGAQVVFGPAARPLPQLHIYADGAGFLRATGDFTGPVGPGFWNRGAQP